MSIQSGLPPVSNLNEICSVSFSREGLIDFKCENNHVSGSVQFPAIKGITDKKLNFAHVDEKSVVFGGKECMTETYHSVHAECGVDVAVQILHSCDGRMAAIRVGCINTGKKNIQLMTISPLSCKKDSEVTAAGANLYDWRVIRMSRQKNDIPGSYRPAVRDEDCTHALLDGTDITAGRGVSADAATNALCNGLTVKCDPCLIIKNSKNEEKPGFFMGFAGQDEHLGHIELTPQEDEPLLRELRAIAYFDGIELNPGHSRFTHWLLFMCGASEQNLLHEFAELQRAQLSHRVKRRAPVIFCSWYFYGLDFLQSDLEENLRELAQKPLAIDGLLIDNGWMDDYGSYRANHRFPDGMEYAANLIRAGGFEPGIWTCPFVISASSKALERWPDMLARQEDGSLCTFGLAEGGARVIDPTHPQGEEYLREVFARLKGWGYTMHKLDYLRALIVNPDIRFYDRCATRAEAYRRGMTIIRETLSEECYILACGGLFEATIGLADGNRIGCDVKGHWNEPKGGEVKKKTSFSMGHMVRIKQNIWRNYTNAFWHTDPDALQLRRRTEPFRGKEEFFALSEGSFTDDEAFTCVVNHYIGGGLVCVSERMQELPQDRLKMIQRVIPPCTDAAEIIDTTSSICPQILRTKISTPFGRWQTLAVFNWSDSPVMKTVELRTLSLDAGEYAVFDQGREEYLGEFGFKKNIAVNIPAHGCRLLRLAKIEDNEPLLVGTDGHLSGGAAEINRIDIKNNELLVELTAAYHHKLKLFFLINTKKIIEIGIPARTQKVKIPCKP